MSCRRVRKISSQAKHVQSRYPVGPAIPGGALAGRTVPAGSTLTIEPGVEVRFDGHYKFIVNGTLLAEGIAANNILFTRNRPTNESRGWGIRFIDASADTSILSYCIIEHGYADDGIWNAALDDRAGGVFCSNSNLIIENCHIRNNTATTGAGIFASMGSGNLTIRSNLIVLTP